MFCDVVLSLICSFTIILQILCFCCPVDVCVLSSWCSGLVFGILVANSVVDSLFAVAPIFESFMFGSCFVL